MSELYIPITTVDEVRPHPNADRLDLAVVKGWQVVVARDSMQAGESVVYVQPDALVPDAWAETWGVKPYLGKGGRVRAVKLRGEPSFGFAIPLKRGLLAEELTGAGYHAEDDVSAYFGITKYVPPPPKTQRPGGPQGFSMPEDARFSRYTDIMNLRHYPDLFDGWDVVVTEKIHGTNSRIGVIGGVNVAGSHRVQRRDPGEVYSEAYERAFERNEQAWYDTLPRWKRWTRDLFFWPTPPWDEVKPSVTYEDSLYWRPWEMPGVRPMLEALGGVNHQVILYGELFGPSVQALGYGVPDGEFSYVAFDLMIDGKYVDYVTFRGVCDAFGVATAPQLYVGPYDLGKIRQMSEGSTTLNEGPHYREGVVVRTVTEQTDPRRGRMIAKYVSDTYLTGGGDAAEDLASDAGEDAAA